MSGPTGVAAATASAAAPRCPTKDSQYGGAAAISGTAALIGAWNADAYHGAACVYAKSRGTWHLQTVLRDPGNSKWDGFGYRVAVTSSRVGTQAMVSSVGETALTSDGIVYVYARKGSVWHRKETVPNPNPVAGSEFGSSMAMSGKTAVIGDDGAGNGSGLVYVYVKFRHSWRLQATITNPSPAAGANFGGDVSLSGLTIAVGDGVQPSPSARPDSGRAVASSRVHAEAYVFTRVGSTWHMQARLTDTSASSASSAAAVAVSGNLALLGAENSGNGEGDTYIFRRTGGTWRRVMILRNPARDDSNFGTSVAIVGRTAVVGAPYGHTCGVAYVYEGSGHKWPLRMKLVPPGKCGGLKLFGWAVAVSGNTAVVGAGYGGAYVMKIP